MITVADKTNEKLLLRSIIFIIVLSIGISAIIGSSVIGSAQSSAVDEKIESNSTDLSDNERIITTELRYPKNVSYIDYANAERNTRQRAQGRLVVQLGSMNLYEERINQTAYSRSKDDSINIINKRRSITPHKESADMVDIRTNLTKESISVKFSEGGGGISKESLSASRAVYNIDPVAAMGKEEIELSFNDKSISTIDINKPHPIFISQIKPVSESSSGYADTNVHDGEVRLRTYRSGSVDELSVKMKSTNSDFSKRARQTRQDNTKSIIYSPETIDNHGKEYLITVDGRPYANLSTEKRVLQGHKLKIEENLSEIDSLKIKFNPDTEGYMTRKTETGYIHAISIDRNRIRVRSQDNVSEFANTERFNQMVNLNSNKKTSTLIIDNSATVVEVNGNKIHQENGETISDQGIFGFLFGD